MTAIPPPPPSPGGGSSSGDSIRPGAQPKSPLIILLVNLVAGAGYFLIGQKLKGFAAVVLWFLVGIPTCGSGAGLLSILYAVDGFFQARMLERGASIGPWTFFSNHR